MKATRIIHSERGLTVRQVVGKPYVFVVTRATKKKLPSPKARRRMHDAEREALAIEGRQK